MYLSRTTLASDYLQQAYDKYGPRSNDPFFTEDRDGVVTFLRPFRDTEEEKYQQLVLQALEPHKLVPPELLSLSRWVHFHLVWDESKKKHRKPPVSPKTGEAIGAAENHYDHHVTFAEAELATYKFRQKSDGNGFVFRAEDGFVGIDFDDCVQHGVIHPEVIKWLKWFSVSYQEFSPSGDGIHCIVRGKIPMALTATALPNTDGVTVEMYSTGRYFTFTGMKISGAPLTITDCQVGIEKLWKELGADSAPRSDGQLHPMSKHTARKLHADNLEALRNAAHGEGNARLNQAAFFAGKAFAAGALDGTEESIKLELLTIVTREWVKPHPEHGAKLTIASGWESGKASPLLIAEDEWPQVVETLEEFNRKFFVVETFGGRCRVCWMEDDPLLGKFLRHQSWADFRNRFINQLIESGIKENGSVRLDDKGKVWFHHRYRQQYERVVFRPGEKTPPHLYNLWRDFDFKPKKGNCDLYLAHLKNIICNGNPQHYDYTIRWMALGVQRPGERGHVALVWRGDKGPGKNLAADAYGKLFGAHYMTITNAEHLVGRFNSHLRGKCVLVANEAFYAGNKQHEATLKGLITDATLPIEQKFVDAETDVNLLHLIIISNNDWVVPASDRERRFFMVDVSGDKIGQYDYFQAIIDQLNRGGYEALLYHLLHEVDISKFNVRDVPKTEALRSQMAASLTGIDAVWYECLCRGEIPGRVKSDGTAWLRASDLIAWASKQRHRGWDNLTAEKVSNLFGTNRRLKDKGLGYKKEQLVLIETGQRNQGWTIPELKRTREDWNQKRFEQAWDDTLTGWQAVPTRAS
jgi:hypothetical protein